MKALVSLQSVDKFASESLRCDFSAPNGGVSPERFPPKNRSISGSDAVSETKRHDAATLTAGLYKQEGQGCCTVKNLPSK